MVINLINQIWIVWCQMAPFLILGFVVAGALSIWVKPSFVQRHLGSGRFSSVLKATLLGIPLPLCSCGVIPVAASLRRQGAGKGATSAFLLATPQTGVDSIAVTYSLMGGFFAVFRPLAALVSGIAGGMIVSLFERNGSSSGDTAGSGSPESGSSGSDPGRVTTEAANGCCGDACHLPDTGSGAGSGTALPSIGEALRYGLVTLPADIGRAVVIGVVIAGAISAFAPPDFFRNLPGGTMVQMLFMMAVGIPLYVCATASVPVAAALILKGISPGAALVFLITGPATNAAAISTIWKIMGRRTAVIYLSVVAVFALLSGLAANFMMRHTPVLTGHLHHEHGLAWWEFAAGVALILILAHAYRPKRTIRVTAITPPVKADVLPRDASLQSSGDPVDRWRFADTEPGVPSGKPAVDGAATAEGGPATQTFNVRGMRCSHCAGMIRQNLESAPGVTRVDVSLETGVVAVRGIGLDRHFLGTIISDLGYDPQL